MIIIQNQTAETIIKPNLFHKETMQMVYPSLTDGLMESHQIFSTTTSFANFRKKATNQIQPTKIRWEEALNVANYATNESEGAQKFQIKT